MKLFRQLLIACLCLALLLPPVYADDAPGQVAIASAHPLATEAGLEILRAGGNAFDAAVAVSAALAVVEPYSSGLGGGGFWLLHRQSDNFQIMVDGRETAPAAARHDMYLDNNGDPVHGLSLNGPLAAGIPGMAAGLVHLTEKYGRLSLKENLKPAWRLAKKGFPVTRLYQLLAKYRLDVLRQSPAAAAIFLDNNEVPAEGHSIVQKDLAITLSRLAIHGRDDFYRGRTAKKLVNAVQQAGGIWTIEDLQKYQIRERHPIVTHYHNMRVVSAPPPSSGGLVLAQILNMLEHFELDAMPDITRKHVIIEAMRRAYRDRAAYMGDPDFVEIDNGHLLNMDYLEGLAATIELDRATSSEEIGGIGVSNQRGENTTHFSILDSDGNRVAATLSINLPFGSGFVATGTGVVLNDEMDDFAKKPLVANAYGLVGNEANQIEAGKRPLSSMTPTFVETKESIGILGTPGGSRIISMVLLGILEFAKGKTPNAWVEVPRYHHQYLPDEVQFEKNGLTTEEQQGLRRMGHTLKEIDRKYGNMQAILWFKPRRLVFAASDPRGEGEAVVTTIQK
ncbi:MAG TPA: gamma-glutamyltransferase [Gammaproteobacteria bacterium]|nr:gamma-glutamyltransferase [Gammaproteobacteria bacterium]